jgi:hypothetical protein
MICNPILIYTVVTEGSRLLLVSASILPGAFAVCGSAFEKKFKGSL